VVSTNDIHNKVEITMNTNPEEHNDMRLDDQLDAWWCADPENEDDFFDADYYEHCMYNGEA
jgi:hypothetical protein